MADPSPALRAAVFAVTPRTPDPNRYGYGTAFVVGRRGATAFLVTCAHVVKGEAGAGGPENVLVRGQPARVIACGSPDDPDDVAVLETELPPEVQPVALEATARAGDACFVLGFDLAGPRPPLNRIHRQRPIDGQIRSQLDFEQNAKRVPVWELAMESAVVGGFSGSPLVHAVTGDVVGITAIGGDASGSAVALSLEALRMVWPRGMAQLERHRVTHRGVELVYVPPGNVIMGTQPERSRALAASQGRRGQIDFTLESPRTSVFTRGYYIGRFPVTNRQYAEFTRAQRWPVPWRPDGLSAAYSWDHATGRYPPGRDEHPVVLVSWHDAQEYCDWLGGRLPTEPEWEKAARGTDSTREWPWGDDWDASRCNTVEHGLGRMTRVQELSPAGDSPFGVAGLAGNVWEWCSSVLGPYPYTLADDRESPHADGTRVLRGGAWGNDRFQARCATRNGASPDDAGFTIGFRVVLPKEAAITPLSDDL